MLFPQESSYLSQQALLCLRKFWFVERGFKRVVLAGWCLWLCMSCAFKTCFVMLSGLAPALFPMQLMVWNCISEAMFLKPPIIQLSVLEES